MFSFHSVLREILRGVPGCRGGVCSSHVPTEGRARLISYRHICHPLAHMLFMVALMCTFVSVPGSRGQAHITVEPSMSKLSGTFAITHFPRRVGWRPRGKNDFLKVIQSWPFLISISGFVLTSSIRFSCCAFLLLWKKRHGP